MPKKEEDIEHDPGDYRYTFAVWTVERPWDHLTKETGVRMSVSRLRAEGGQVQWILGGIRAHEFPCNYERIIL